MDKNTEDRMLMYIVWRIDESERQWLRWLLRKSPEYKPELDPHYFEKHKEFFCPGRIYCYYHKKVTNGIDGAPNRRC